MTGGHTAARRAVARAAFINCRLRDVPAVYHGMVPYSYSACELWIAEKAIRARLAEDLKLLASPWRSIGPLPQVLDYTGMSAIDELTFGFEAEVPLGMDAQPRRPITLPASPAPVPDREPVDDMEPGPAERHMVARRRERQREIDAANKPDGDRPPPDKKS